MNLDLRHWLWEYLMLNAAVDSQWEREQATKVEAYDSEERNAKNALTEQAAKEIEAFYATRKNRIEQSKQNNL